MYGVRRSMGDNVRESTAAAEPSFTSGCRVLPVLNRPSVAMTYGSLLLAGHGKCKVDIPAGMWNHATIVLSRSLDAYLSSGAKNITNSAGMLTQRLVIVFDEILLRVTNLFTILFLLNPL